METKKLPKIGFMPPFENFGDTYPLLEIAKKYKEIGGESVFIGYKERYEYLARENEFKIINLKKNTSKDFATEFEKIIYEYCYKNRPREKTFKFFFNKKHMQFFYDTIDQEIEIIKQEKIKLIVATFHFTSPISTNVTKIPLVNILSGVAAAPYFESNYATFPDNLESFFTRLIPKSIKNYFTNFYMLKCKIGVKVYNRIADKYESPKVKYFLDILHGDYILLADDINFLMLSPTIDFPLENFIGPILPDRSIKKSKEIISPDIQKHLQKPGRSILLSMGSSGTNKTFNDILNTLNQTNYIVIAIYTNILNEKELRKFKNNILLKKFVPDIKKINEKVDLAIIHGGRGTVYTAAYSGKPAIGIPMHSEQQYNLDNLVRNGTTIMLSRKKFKEKKLLNTIEEIFSNYEKYHENAKKLKRKLPPPNGAENAVKRILEIANLEKTKDKSFNKKNNKK